MKKLLWTMALATGVIFSEYAPAHASGSVWIGCYNGNENLDGTLEKAKEVAAACDEEAAVWQPLYDARFDPQ